MKTTYTLLLMSSLVVSAETDERIEKTFTVQPAGKIVVDVDFGSIDVTTHSSDEVSVDVVRKVSRGSKSDEEEFLSDRPITFSQEGNTITVHSRAKSALNEFRRGKQRTEAKYTITVPTQFGAQLKTAGGGVAVTGLAGEVNAVTAGGGLKFARLNGGLDGVTSGGSIGIAECKGTTKVKTGGGGIDVSGGSGSLVGVTSGGSIEVKNFHGPVEVRTGGGGITMEGVVGRAEGSTSGGSISAKFPSALSDEVKLTTSGGGVTVSLPADAAFTLDASSSGGGVRSDLPVETDGKPRRDHLKGPVNGGGKSVTLHTGGGSIQVKKL